MSDSFLGGLCIVLHGHLPYVLHHGVWPHGEAWLFEAAAETYLPLIEMLEALGRNGVRAGLTVGLTPVLLEQLAHSHFKAGFADYLQSRLERARRDRAEFEAGRQRHFAYLAERWERWHERKIEQFEALERDLVNPFAAAARSGAVQLLTSNATHAYMPLLLNEASLRAQMTLGTRTSERHFGFRCPGMWLPECAYQPRWEKWIPWVLFGDPRHRPGTEEFLAREGVTHFFVDSHLMTEAEAMGTLDDGVFTPAGEGQAHWDESRAWRSTLEPAGVASGRETPKCFAFARHPDVSAKVWSGVVGYPGSPEYLDFHRKHGEAGLRYHKVTDISVPMDQKQAYLPSDTADLLKRHVAHFCQTVKAALAEHKQKTGRRGVCTAPFDAELFGHWWFEGPAFLQGVIETLANDPTIGLTTALEALDRQPPDKVVRMPEGSWGRDGKHDPWLNDSTRWMWEVEYRAENQFLKLLHALPWRTNGDVKALMIRLAREMLLLQASDWPFVVFSKGATDYGHERFSLHSARFNRLSAMAEATAAGRLLTAVQQSELQEIDAHEVIFADIDLTWWL